MIDPFKAKQNSKVTCGFRFPFKLLLTVIQVTKTLKPLQPGTHVHIKDEKNTGTVT